MRVKVYSVKARQRVKAREDTTKNPRDCAKNRRIRGGCTQKVGIGDAARTLKATDVDPSQMVSRRSGAIELLKILHHGAFVY